MADKDKPQNLIKCLVDLPNQLKSKIFCLNIKKTSEEVLRRLIIILEIERGFEFKIGKLAYQNNKKDFVWINFCANEYCFADNNPSEIEMELDSNTIIILIYILSILRPIK